MGSTDNNSCIKFADICPDYNIYKFEYGICKLGVMVAEATFFSQGIFDLANKKYLSGLTKIGLGLGLFVSDNIISSVGTIIQQKEWVCTKDEQLAVYYMCGDEAYNDIYREVAGDISI